MRELYLLTLLLLVNIDQAFSSVCKYSFFLSSQPREAAAMLIIQRRNGSEKGQVGPVWNLKVGRISPSHLLSIEGSLSWTQPANCRDRELWPVSPDETSNSRGWQGRPAACGLFVVYQGATWWPLRTERALTPDPLHPPPPSKR